MLFFVFFRVLLLQPGVAGVVSNPSFIRVSSSGPIWPPRACSLHLGLRSLVHRASLGLGGVYLEALLLLEEATALVERVRAFEPPFDDATKGARHFSARADDAGKPPSTKRSRWYSRQAGRSPHASQHRRDYRGQLCTSLPAGRESRSYVCTVRACAHACGSARTGGRIA